MTYPVRGQIVAAAGLENPETMTLREAVDWYKNAVRVGTEAGATALEIKTIEQSWAELVRCLAEREGITPGALRYLLSELARGEIINEANKEMHRMQQE